MLTALVGPTIKVNQSADVLVWIPAIGSTEAFSNADPVRTVRRPCSRHTLAHSGGSKAAAGG